MEELNEENVVVKEVQSILQTADLSTVSLKELMSLLEVRLEMDVAPLKSLIKTTMNDFIETLLSRNIEEDEPYNSTHIPSDNSDEEEGTEGDQDEDEVEEEVARNSTTTIKKKCA
jgi:hypothetical protein